MSHFVYQPPQQALDLLYEDSDFITINKPSGLLSVPGRLPEHQDSAYLRILALYPEARVTHRLDMATSGVLVFAKHRNAEIAMSKIFQARQITKNYVALVQGHLEGNGEVDIPLITDWPNRPKQKVDFLEGRPSQTLYSALEYNEKEQHTRVNLCPITGRSHQLRVHMLHIGHPIMGDQFYHPNPQRFKPQRMALHAQSLAFIQPFTQEEILLYSPADF